MNLQRRIGQTAHKMLKRTDHSVVANQKTAVALGHLAAAPYRSSQKLRGMRYRFIDRLQTRRRRLQHGVQHHRDADQILPHTIVQFSRQSLCFFHSLGAQSSFDILFPGPEGNQIPVRRPQFELIDHLLAKQVQTLELRRREFARLGIHDRQRAENRAARRHQGYPGVEAHVRRACDKGIVGKAGIEPHILANNTAPLKDDVSTGCPFAGNLLQGYADARFEPLSSFVGEAHQRVRSLCQLAGESGQAVKGLFGIRIEHLVASQLE
jgi:hypothetical protein